MEDSFEKFWLVSTYACDNRCPGCYTKAKGFCRDELPCEVATAIMDEMQALGAKQCVLIGGEPTMWHELFEILKYGKEKGLFMKIVTNGRKLADKGFLQRMIDAGLNFAAISVHGTTAEEHLATTGVKRSFEQTLQGLRNCQELKLPFITLSTINAANKDRVIEIARFIHDLGVENIVFNLASPIEGDESNDRILSPRDLADIITKAYLALKAAGIKAHFYATVPLCLFDRDILMKMIDESYLVPLSGGEISECNIYDGSGIAFDPKGEILTCTHQVNSPVGSILNDQHKIRTREEIRDILLRVRQTIGPENWEYPSEDCDACDMRMKCIGGCPLFWRTFDSKKYVDGNF